MIKNQAAPSPLTYLAHNDVVVFSITPTGSMCSLARKQCRELGWHDFNPAAHEEAICLPILGNDERLLPPSVTLYHLSRLYAMALSRPSTRFIITPLSRDAKATAHLLYNRNPKLPPMPRNIALPQDYWRHINTAPAPNPCRQAKYDKYMQGEHWANLRRAASERWGRICLICSDDELVEFHHIRYRPDLTTCTTDDVIPLCPRHHRHYHCLKVTHPASIRQIVNETNPGQMIALIRKLYEDTMPRFTPQSRSHVSLNKTVLQDRPARPKWRSYHGR